VGFERLAGAKEVGIWQYAVGKFPKIIE